MERDVRPLSPPPHILPDPQQRSPPPGSPNRTPTERDAPFPEPSFNYLSKFAVNVLPHPQVPQRGPYRERHSFPDPSSTHPLKTDLSLKVPSTDAPSPEPMVYFFTYICWSPKLRSLPWKWGKNTVTIHAAPCRWKAYIKWGAVWFPKGYVYDTAITAPVLFWKAQHKYWRDPMTNSKHSNRQTTHCQCHIDIDNCVPSNCFTNNWNLK